MIGDHHRDDHDNDDGHDAPPDDLETRFDRWFGGMTERQYARAMQDGVPSVVRDMLSEGEKIVWLDKPRQGPLLTPYILLWLVLIGVPSGALLVYLYPSPVSVLAAIGLSFLFDAFLRTQIYYVLTDRRVGRAVSWPFDSISEIPHGDWSSIRFTRVHGNSGVITFDSRGDDIRFVRWAVLKDFEETISKAKAYRREEHTGPR